MDKEKDFDDLELEHLLGPFKRLEAGENQKATWRLAIENRTINPFKSGRKLNQPHFKLNPWGVVLLSNLLIALVIILSLPIVRHELIGHEIAIQMQDTPNPVSYHQLAKLSSLKEAKLFRDKSREAAATGTITLVQKNQIDLHLIEAQILGIQDVRTLKVSPILKDETQRLYKNIISFFNLSQPNPKDCYNWFLINKGLEVDGGSFLPIAKVVELSKTEIVKSPSPLDSNPIPSRQALKGHENLLRKVTIKK